MAAKRKTRKTKGLRGTGSRRGPGSRGTSPPRARAMSRLRRNRRR
jgi:hypothetical protein